MSQSVIYKLLLLKWLLPEKGTTYTLIYYCLSKKAKPDWDFFALTPTTVWTHHPPALVKKPHPSSIRMHSWANDCQLEGGTKKPDSQVSGKGTCFQATTHPEVENNFSLVGLTPSNGRSHTLDILTASSSTGPYSEWVSGWMTEAALCQPVCPQQLILMF